jgi:hypothetical protein
MSVYRENGSVLKVSVVWNIPEIHKNHLYQVKCRFEGTGSVS